MPQPSVVVCIIAASIVFNWAVTFGDLQPSFKTTTKRGDDRVEVKIENGKTLFSVHSPCGISHAVIERRVEKWPDTVVLRLKLKGLESFRATNGMVTLEASVSSQDGKVRLWKEGQEDSPLDSKNPYWIAIHVVGKDGNPSKTIPLEGGYFEMQLPAALFEGNPKSITVNWIDFYRN